MGQRVWNSRHALLFAGLVFALETKYLKVDAVLRIRTTRIELAHQPCMYV